MNAIVAYILNNIPEIAMLIIIGVLAWKIANYFSKFENRLKAVEGGITDLHNEVSVLKDSLSSLKADVVDIQLFITSKFPTAVNTFAAKHSPLRLNEMGQKLYDEIKGKSFLDANQVTLFKAIDEKKPQTALDVEASAKEVLLALTSNAIFNPIKIWIYNSPAWKINGKDYMISLGDVCFVLSIPLRDKYLELHKEIAQ